MQKNKPKTIIKCDSNTTDETNFSHKLLITEKLFKAFCI